MVRMRNFILIIGAMILLLTGCGEGSTNNTKDEKVVIADKKDPTAWEGNWIYQENEDESLTNGAIPEDAITLQIVDNSDGKFNYKIEHSGELVAEGTAKLGGKNSYSHRNENDDCTISFNERNLNIDIGSYGTSEECMNIESLGIDDNGSGLFVRHQTELENFKQILFLTPEQDQIVLNLVGKDVYAELVEKFKDFELLSSHENLAKSYVNKSFSITENDENLLIMFNKYDLFWIAYGKEGTLNYYTNDKWSSEYVPETIASAFPGMVDVKYMNKDNAEEFVAESFTDFPLLNSYNSTNTRELISSEGNGSYSLRTYYNLGVDSQYKHGDFVAFLNENYNELGLTLTLDKGNAATVYFVRDNYKRSVIDAEQDFTGDILGSVQLTSSDPQYSMGLGVFDVTELHIVVASDYDDDVLVTIDDIDLISYMHESIETEANQSEETNTENSSSAEVINNDESSQSEEDLEVRLQNFLNEYCLAIKNGDFRKAYDMWDGSWGEYGSSREEYIDTMESERETEVEQDATIEVNMEFVEIVDFAAEEEDGLVYMKVLVEIYVKMVKDGEVLQESRDLAYAYIAPATGAKYGFLIDDDLDDVE